VVVHTEHGGNRPGHRYWNGDEPVWNDDGDTALLKNRSLSVVDRCTCGSGASSPLRC
jgi:hypothetical protein